MATQHISRNYETAFDPWAYYCQYYKEVTEGHRQPLSLLHELYKSYGSPPASLKVLDFGAGPIPIYEISASLYASEIVFSEYVESNRKALQMWLDRDPNAQDWSPFFEYVVQELEGKGKEDAAIRQEEMRRLVKAVVPCDITKDPPIEPTYQGPYDIIYSSLCLECACDTLGEYAGAVSKLSKLIKPGGKLVLNAVEGHGKFSFYVVGGEKFVSLSLTEEALTAILQQNGFIDIRIQRQTRDTPGVNIPQETDDFVAMLFAIATRE